MRRRISFSILFVLIAAVNLSAAEVEPQLESAMLRAPSSDLFSVIVKLHNPQDIHALDQQLHARRAPLPERHRLVIAALKSNASLTQGPVIDRLNDMKQANRIVGFTPYWIENLIVVYGHAEAVLELADDPAVESIGPNFKAELIEPVPRGPVRGQHEGALDTHTKTVGQRATGATRVNEELGITGQGTLVAGCDTGVDGTHPALASRWRGNDHPVSECWLDLIGGRPNPVDLNSHGTHTMGTMCGEEIQADGDTITVGAAPQAHWIATNPIDQGVSPNFTQDIFDAYEWLTDPDGNPNTMDDVPDVIQNSWGVTVGHVGTHCYNNWNTAITNCEAAGPVVVWSAGNEGPGATSLRSPATYELNTWQIFSVGAVDLSSDSIAPYPIASFSSRGPSGCDPDAQAIKPEICAPGVNVLSSVPGGGYQSNGWSGTSMSGPHVSGVVALMREACPSCDPETIKEALMATAVDSGYPPTGDDNTFGHGFLNAYDAVLAVANLGRIDGYVTLPNDDPIAGVLVQPLPGTTSALSDSDGYYNVTAEEGEYTVRFSKFGFETVTVPNVETFEGDTTRVNVTMNPAAAGILAGQVVLQSGLGVQGAHVVIEDTPIDTLITDANGYFIQELPATNYDIHASMYVNITPPLLIETDTTLTIGAGDTTHATIEMFVEMIEPTDPDTYGYRAYDRYDRDMPAPHDWIELDPTLGGEGIPFGFVHHDSSTYLATPFPISFYGTASDSLTINANGWMLPGIHHDRGNNNYPIPYDAPIDPPGIIAPYWADMRIGLGGQQFMWYDTYNGRWIFEFQSQHRVAPANRILNWEVIFLDPAFYPTATSDCEFLFIYGTLEYTASTTIGIEDPLENTGLQILYNGTLDPTAWPIEEGAALRFTTGQPSQIGRVVTTMGMHPEPSNMTGALLHAGGRAILPHGSDMYFDDDSVAAGLVCMMFEYEGYEAARLDRIQLNPGGTINEEITAWRLDPPHDLSASQTDGRVTLSWHRPVSVESSTPPYEISYSVYRDGQEWALVLSDTTFTDEWQPDSAEVSYTVTTHYRYGTSDFSDTMTVLIDLAAEVSNSTLPTEFMLYQNYPNPFNPTTSIRFDVPDPADTRLEIFDVNGRLVRTLYDGVLAAGRHQFSWNSTDDGEQQVASGLYLCRVVSPKYTATQKMLLVK